MEKVYVCPNTQICPIYGMVYTNEKGKYLGGRSKIDPIREDGEKYSCKMLELFNKYITPIKDERIEQFPAECALIRLLNNSKALLNLSAKIK